MDADRQDGTARPTPAPGNWRWVGVSALFVALAMTAWIGVYTIPYRQAAERARNGKGTPLPGGRQPNVVVFLIDTLRADRLGVYGYDKPTSPRIDALARQSTVFTHCYAAAPWTLPSVVSLMTSQFSCEHGVVIDGQAVSTSTKTVAERMKQAGYQTASFYANPYAGPISGLDRGFDHCAFHRFADGEVLDAWLDTAGDEPFFLYIHNIEPHDGFLAPQRLVAEFGSVPQARMDAIGKMLQKYRQLTRADFAAGRPVGTTDNTDEQTQLMRQLAGHLDEINVMYDAAVRLADERVGSVIDALKRRGVWDDTIFIVTADHGQEFYEHGGWQHDQSEYEELVHVPLIVRQPPGTAHVDKLDAIVSLVDVAPTLTGALGLESPPTWRGRSWYAALRPGAPPVPDDNPVIPSIRINRKKYYRPYKESRGDTNIVARLGSWKGIHDVEIDKYELYDLAADPGEQHDVAADHPDLVAQLRAASGPWLRACVAAGAGQSGESAGKMNDVVRERLRSLGYID